MCKYYLQITVALKFFLMGDLFIREKFSVAIPSIEKGVDKVSEYLTEKIYDCINGELLRHNVADVEDLRLEIRFINWFKCIGRYEIQLVDKFEVVSPDSSIFIEKMKYKMVQIERRSAKQLASISRNMYGNIYGG